ncbi:MAG: hypothetical protein ACTHMC_01595 [Pseudobacter sp.]|uniref:hypothetical protein n=1 Tax=Pseudobacter sp. TaxID=2045420 RepID=UPI003F7F8AE4
MSLIDSLHAFEFQSTHQLVYNMVKWFCFDEVEYTTRHRPNVESTVWMQLTIEKDGKKWVVEGQRLDIVKRRLIEFLDKQGIRGERTGSDFHEQLPAEVSEHSDALASPPNFDQLVSIIEKLFRENLENFKIDPGRIALAWKRYKALNHLYRDAPGTPMDQNIEGRV